MYLLLFLLFFADNLAEKEPISVSDKLKIEYLSENIARHISLLEIPNYGNFPCNGMLYFQKDSVFIFDSPTTEKQSLDLIKWCDSNGFGISGLLVNHYHVDCTAGIDLFLEREIPVYSSKLTCELSKSDSVSCAEVKFQDSLIIGFAGSKIVNIYLGKAHTSDNIVSYIPSERALFGGCMVKALGWGKGNLADSDTVDWPKTIKNVKHRFPEAYIIIPGHGAAGSQELLDYTIEMFEVK